MPRRYDLNVVGRRLFERHFTAQIGKQTGNTVCPHHRQLRIETPVCKPPHLVHRAMLHHKLKPPVDPLTQYLPVRGEKYADAILRPEQRAATIVLVRGERLAARLEYFQRAHKTLMIAGPDSFRQHRVNRSQLPVQF